MKTKKMALVLCLLLAVSLLTPAALASDEGLAAQWSFDGDITDSSGSGRDLTVTLGDAKYEDGISGQALVLDGQTLLSMAPEHAISSENLTLSVLIKINSFPESDNDTNCLIVNEYLGALGVGAMDFGVRNGKLYSYVCGANWQAGDTLTSITDADTLVGQWTHVAVVFDQDAGIGYLYINGELDFELDLFNTLGLPATFGYMGELPSAVNIGGYLEGETLKRSFDGSVDDMRIYTRALSADEIADMTTAYGVANAENPAPSEAPEQSEAPAQSESEAPSKTPAPTTPAGQDDGDEGGFNPLIIVVIVVGVVLAAVVLIFALKGKKS